MAVDCSSVGGSSEIRGAFICASAVQDVLNLDENMICKITILGIFSGDWVLGHGLDCPRGTFFLVGDGNIC